jgi:PAS domain S-box-containing protein
MPLHLTKRIFLTVTALMLGLLLVTSWLGINHFTREFDRLTAEHLAVMIGSAAQDADLHLQQADMMLRAIDRTLPRSLLNNRPALQEALQRLGAESLIFDAGLQISRADGLLLASGPGGDQRQPPRPVVNEFVAAVAASGRAQLSPPLLLPGTERHPQIIFARPLRDEQGKVAAILAGHIDLLGSNPLAQRLARPVGRTGHLAVLDRSGTVILSSNHKLVMAAGTEMLPPDVLQQVLLGSDGAARGVAVRGTEQLLHYQALQAAPWIVVGTYPEEELREPLHRAKFFVVVELLLLTAIIVVTVRFLSNRLTEPLTALSSEVRRQIAPGAFFTPPPAGGVRELGELSEAIDLLLSKLARQRGELADQLFFLQNLIDTIPSPIFYKDGQFRYLGCNQAFSEYIGIGREDLIGKSVYEIAPLELAEVYNRADCELWEQGGSQVYEASVKYADGSMHDVIFYKSVFRDLAGQPAGLLGVFLDITARKQAEIRLKEALAETDAAREQVDDVLSSAADGVVVTNRRNRVTHINQVASDLLGVTAGEVTGKSFVRLFKNPELRRQAGSFLADGDLMTREHDFLLTPSGGGEPLIILTKAAPLRDRHGKLRGLVTLLRDVTRERELDLLKSQFISTAAHEMRTPMAVIMGYAELLLDRELVSTFPVQQQEEFLCEIYRKADILSRMVDDLFDISRIEAGQPLSLDRVHCDLNSVIEEVVQRFVANSPRHSFAVSLTTPRMADVDCNKIAQVFENLVSNAVKYSPRGGRIEVRSESCAEGVRFVVSDEGIGMTPAQVERIFDKFYRADHANTAVNGLGIGMSIARMIVETHGGHIWVESQPQAGTRVIFEIPTR